jgi:hypothetical protein
MSRKRPRPEATSLAQRALDVLICRLRGHRWTQSRTRPGYRTCVRCKRRERRPALAEGASAEQPGLG